MDVLPTDWSPRNTSLYLASGARDVPPEDFLDDGSEALILFNKWMYCYFSIGVARLISLVR